MRIVNCLGPDKVDNLYFGRALAAMERELEVGPLTVYLTFDVDELPSYGDDVVVVLIGDEWARAPAYLPRVRAVFRNLCTRPNLGAPLLPRPSLVTLSALLPVTRAAFRAAQSRLALVGRRRAPQIELPIGTYNVLDLPVKPVAERTADLFFAGSVVQTPGPTAWLKTRVMPKGLARNAMLRSLKRLERRRALSVDLRITPGFQESAAADPGEYSRALMDSRIALVPRGATTETHRFFQALKYGCVVVTDAVPPIWFYEQAPMLRLRTWSELEQAVAPLLEAPERMEALHRQSLAWWESACSEEAVGRFMAHTLNSLA